MIYSRIASECGHGLAAGQTVGGATGGTDSGGRKGWGTASAADTKCKEGFVWQAKCESPGPRVRKAISRDSRKGRRALRQGKQDQET